MVELRKIKEQCSLEALSRTPEEQRLEEQKAIEWFENAIGRKIPVVDYSRSAKEVALV
jgi:hypothetical protein